MNVINVLVTGCGGGSIGEQVIKCLRLSKLNCRIIATDVTEVSKGKIDGDEFVIVPYANSDEYITTLLNICAGNKIDVVIPGSEVELKVISSSKVLFEQKSIHLLINSQDILRTCLDKNLTSKFLADNGFYTPLSTEVRSVDDLAKLNKFPLVLKPSIGGGGSVNTLIAQNEKELQLFSMFLLEQYPAFIAQEYVGDGESEYTVGILSDKDQNIIDSIILKRNILSGLGSKLKVKNKTNQTQLGNYLVISSGISQGEIIKNVLIRNTCEKLAVSLGSIGPLNIQCRLVDEKLYVFEINPRFSGTSPMRAMAGFNEVELMIRNLILNEQHFARINYQLGHVVRGLSEYFV
jgi:carbamoyl-phosphate synthase large subunit